MIFMDEGTESNNINILTPYPSSYNACYSKVLATFAYKHAKITALNSHCEGTCHLYPWQSILLDCFTSFAMTFSTKHSTENPICLVHSRMQTI